MKTESRKAPALLVLAFVLSLIGVQLWQGFKGFEVASSPLAAPGALLGWGGVLVLVVLFGWLLAGWWGRDLFGLAGATGLAVRVLGVVALGVAVAGLAGLAGGAGAGGDLGAGLASLLEGLLGGPLATLLLLLMAIPGLVLAAAPFFRTATPPTPPDALPDAVASLDPPPGVFEGSAKGRESSYPPRRYDEDGHEIPISFDGRDVGPVRYADDEDAVLEVPRIKPPPVEPPDPDDLPAGVRFADEEEDLGDPEDDEGASAAGAGDREYLSPGVRYADQDDDEPGEDESEDGEFEEEDGAEEEGAEEGEDEEDEELEDEGERGEDEPEEEELEDEEEGAEEDEYEEAEEGEEEEYEDEELEDEEELEEDEEDELEDELEEDEDEEGAEEDEYEEDEGELEAEELEGEDELEDAEDEAEADAEEPDEEPGATEAAPAARTEEEQEEARARYRAKLEGSGFFDNSEPVEVDAPPAARGKAGKRPAEVAGKGSGSSSAKKTGSRKAGSKKAATKKAAGKKAATKKAAGKKAAGKKSASKRAADEHPPLPLTDPGGEPQARKGSASLSDEELVDRAVRVAIERGAASSVLLSRRLGIGYARARTLMDVLVKRGVLGNMGPSGSRPVQITQADWDAGS